jgi:GMP synthase PP-ATPase subunit
VEYSPYQKVPKNLKNAKKDALKVDTIDEDSEFLTFVEELENEELKQQETPENFLDEIEKKEKELKVKESTTPLLLFIKVGN